MDDARQSDVPPALRGGRLEGITFPDLLWALCRRRSTGVLRVAAGGAERALYLDRGRIVFASSSDPNDRLGELFLREGRITIDQLETAVTRSDSGKRLGTLLVESGALTADQLVQGVLAQVERIVLGLFAVEEGDYRFEDGPLPTDEVITLGMRTGELILRGIRQIRSFGRIRRSVGGPLKVYGLADGWRGLAEGLRLSDGEQQLLDRLRARDASIDSLCREVYLSNFEIYQTLLGFRVLGLAEEREPRREPVTEATSHGVLGDDGFAELLVRLGRASETGVLYVTRGGQERTFHVSAGRCVFATSNDPDDGLVAYLLRRGVISLADREETAKRLLSNKRVGTILRELGVIDERDLREMVRRQLSEIVFDTFRWANADYAFVRGSLPTIEEITLEETLESLVAAGLRRVDSWTRVWHGCSGLEAALELRPSYLAVLDAMQAGADEWQIVATLKTPRTVREICRASDLGDFRVCQILWTLRLLGAVGPASVEARDTAIDAPEVSVALPVAVAAHERAVVEDEPVEVELEVGATAEPDEPGSDVWADEKIVIEIDREAPARVAAERHDPGLDATQLIPPEALESALRGSSRGSIDATQTIDADVLDAAQALESDDPAQGDVGRPEDTGPISTDELERTLVASGMPEASPAVEAWVEPSELDDVLARFNAAHRLVYRAVRSEIGAGATNFLRATCTQRAPAAARLVEGVALAPDGSWDPEALRNRAVAGRVSDPWSDYLSLLDAEIERIGEFLGKSRAEDLRRQIEALDEAPAARA